MKMTSDRIMAERLLVVRSHGFRPRPFIRRNVRRYAVYALPLAGLLGCFAHNGWWQAFNALAFFLLGFFFLYLQWWRGMGKSWPFLSGVTNWEEVERLAKSEPPA